MKSRKFLPVCLCWLTVSVMMVIVGLVLIFIWPMLFQYLIDSNMVLHKDGHVYELWRKFPEAFPIDFYFFNWTNPEDVYNDTVKLKFQELGPYRFSETKEKTDIVWNDNGTVSYKHLKYWYYDEDKAINNIQDRITTVNPVALSAGYSARNWNYLLRKGLSLPLSSMSPTIHITHTVSEMLFEGYKDPLISMARSLPLVGAGSLPPWDKFGWFYTRNGSAEYEGVFNMGTGFNTTFGRLYTWKFWSQTPYYQEKCGKVDGSAGEFFVNQQKDVISLFAPDLCRVMFLRLKGQVLVKNILGNKYIIDDYMLDNGTVFPENKCYCNGECVLSGVLNVSSCRFNSPSFASLPHFHQADPYFIESIEGVAPKSEKHDFYMILEPTTNIPLEVSARLQINLLMQPVSGIALYANAPRVFIPMLWFEQRVGIPDSEAFNLRLLLNLPVICTSLGVALIFVGCILLSCLVYKMCNTKICRRKNDAYMHPEQNIPLKTECSVEMIRKF